MSSTTTDAPFVFTAGMAMPGLGGDAASGRSGSAGTPPAADDLIRQTRREISEIVREVAELSRRSIPLESFFSALLDRTTRALAAEGAVLWDMTADGPQPVLRNGRVHDQSIAARGRVAHDTMLAEIAASGHPVVVPPTPIGSATGSGSGPATWVPDQPANPTDRPAAVVPILDPLATATDGSRYLLEVFLEPEAGVATQRGYLRFTAQMADLASDFLRLDELRRGRAHLAASQRLASVLPKIHRHDCLHACAAEIVDRLAEWLSTSRVTLVQLPPVDRSGDGGDAGRRARRCRILAISHVEAIDHRGAACRALVERIANLELTPGQAHVLAEPPTNAKTFANAKTPDAHDNTAAPRDDAPLTAILAMSLGDDDRYRLLVQCQSTRRLTPHEVDMVQSFGQHSFEALRSIERIAAVPLARTWLSIFGGRTGTRIDRRVWLSRAVLAAIAATIVGVAALVPKTMNVSLAATLRPANVRTHYAPSDAVVQQVLVRHGDTVVAGQAMLVLQDLALDEQVTTLIGRRAVVSEKLARVVGSLVELPPSGVRGGTRESGHTSDDALVQQQRLLEEEQRGIDQQLDLLAEARQRLVIRADRAGTVDAWQTELVALGRPVRIGETLVRVQPSETQWVVDARVPQNRRQLVMRRLVDQPTAIRLWVGDRDGDTTTATFHRQIGFETSGGGGPPVTVVELLVDTKVAADSADRAAEPPSRWRSGMPVDVQVDCGDMPLAKVLFFDLFRSIRLRWKTYF